MDATRHGLFRRLRRAISRTPLVPVWPDPAGTPSPKPFLRSSVSLWGYDALRAAPGLEAPAGLPAATAGGYGVRAGGAGQGWLRPEHIVEPVWYAEDEENPAGGYGRAASCGPAGPARGR